MPKNNPGPQDKECRHAEQIAAIAASAPGRSGQIATDKRRARFCEHAARLQPGVIHAGLARQDEFDLFANFRLYYSNVNPPKCTRRNDVFEKSTYPAPGDYIETTR